MITLFPENYKTLVLAHSQGEVTRRLLNLANIEEDAPQQYKPLMGWVKSDQFQVALRARRPNGFAPIATGKIESTSNGCLVFLNYQLMPSTRFYLAFWSLIALLTGIVMTLHYENLNLGLASLGILAFINGTAWANFHLHLKVLHNTLLTAME